MSLRPLLICVVWLSVGALAARAEPSVVGQVTFNRDVAPIVFNRCATCHRAGEVAPFALTSYADARKHAKQIVRVTGEHLMPPWKADEGAETFLDARRLSDAEVWTIRRWVEQGEVEGKASDLPALPKFAEGWQLGEPDVVLEPGEAFHVAADGSDVYRCFVFPTNYPEDRYVAAMEVRAGNRAIVHHAIGYVDTSGAARRLDAADPGPGYTAFGGVGFVPVATLDGWGPGVAPRRLPDGIGMALPKGADVVVQLHYHPDGKPETDRTRIGLYFCKKPVDKRMNMTVAINPGVNIPPGAAHHEERATLTIPQDITLVRIAPHMHLIGKDITVTATLPDGTTRKLVSVPNWEFRWQTVFTFKEPVALPRGSRVEVVAHYDNTAENPENPSRPPRPVRWGEGTTDEMCIAALFYTVDAEHLTKGVVTEAFAPPPGSSKPAGGGNAREAMAMQLFDTNGDGKLDAAERERAMTFIEQWKGGHLSPQERAGAERFLDRIGGTVEAKGAKP